jgi:hypothetical protein
MGIDELALIGTGFVLARVLWLVYFAPRRVASAPGAGRPRDRA